MSKKMKLQVGVIEARNLPDVNGNRDPFVKLKLGRQKGKTKVMKKCLNPTWGEEFTFSVDDGKDELLLYVLDEDKHFSDDLIGKLKLPISQILDAENKSLGNSWYILKPKNKKSKKDCGEILLSICIFQKGIAIPPNTDPFITSSIKSPELVAESPAMSFGDPSFSPSPLRSEENKEEKPCGQKKLADRIAQIFSKSSDTASTVSSKGMDYADLTEVADIPDHRADDQSCSTSFEEFMRTMESQDQGSETPTNLPGGVLLDQLYLLTSLDLNTLLFSPDSNFYSSFTEMQGTTELQMGPWKYEGESWKRVLSYVKSPTKMTKAIKATEEQTYLKADGKVYAVLATVSTPDVMYGSTFKIELLYVIAHGPELQPGEQCSRLVISWRMNFVQSTMMKGMIEKAAGQGLKESYDQYASLLAQNAKQVDSKDIGLNKEQVLASLQVEVQSDWKLAIQYFANFTVISTFVVGIYFFVHLCLASPSTIQGLEFVGLDLPDSIGEFIVSGVLFLQGERALQLISRFLKARKQRGSDHGVKAQGDGWLLTVALMEGSALAAINTSGFCDPYVVFTCNGRTRTSSIKFQKSNPHWNEIFEFDAMDDPPSVLDVEVFDFDGPFDSPKSLGHAEINFVRCNISDLADVWIPLRGKLAKACQSKLHLRIFLDNTRGGNVVKDYISKMEKEVGKKITLRSPQTNSAFQKVFGLPPEEFLINDFSCHLKRKMPLQGRLCLSARIIGFHTNLFGIKTKFFFLYEDVEDIQVNPPTLASMGSPIIVMTLRPGRGVEARHGAKTQDEEGRLKFHFHSFVSFNIAHRTIMALWRARASNSEQKMQLVEEESESKLQNEECGSVTVADDVSMHEVYSSNLPVPVNAVMELFDGGELERRAMERTGCQNYSSSPWELEKGDVHVRETYYRFDKSISQYRGDATCSQHKSPLPDKNGWLVEEVITLHGVPLGDCFNLHLRYQIEDSLPRPTGCCVRVFCGLKWLKSIKHKKRITKSVLSNLHERLMVIFGMVEKEFNDR